MVFILCRLCTEQTDRTHFHLFGVKKRIIGLLKGLNHLLRTSIDRLRRYMHRISGESKALPLHQQTWRGLPKQAGVSGGQRSVG